MPVQWYTRRRNILQDRVDFIQILLEAQLDSSKSEYVKNGTSIVNGHNGKEEHSLKSTIYSKYYQFEQKVTNSSGLFL